MPGSASYDRYGLTGNPFRDLASESVSDVELFHVNLGIDESLRTIIDEVLEKENKALVALVGNHGTGKTERLLLAAAQARERKAFVVFFDLTDRTSWVLRGIALEMRRAARLSGFGRLFASPPWYRQLAGLARPRAEAYDPIAAGKAIGAALNANAPAFLLLNDLHHLSNATDAQAFARTLQEISDVVRPGVLVMFGAYPAFMVGLTQNRPPFASRINRTLLLPSLGGEEAALLLAKKLLAKRLVEALDPLYPFDRESIEELNRAAYGNPRRLLELADRALEYGVAHRSNRIDADTVRAAMSPPTAKELHDAMPIPEGPAPTRPKAAPVAQRAGAKSPAPRG